MANTNLIAPSAQSEASGSRADAFPLRGRWVNEVNPDEVEECPEMYVHPGRVQVKSYILRLPCVKGGGISPHKICDFSGHEGRLCRPEGKVAIYREI